MTENALRAFRQVIERLSDDAISELLDHLAAEPRLFTRDGALLLLETAKERGASLMKNRLDLLYAELQTDDVDPRQMSDELLVAAVRGIAANQAWRLAVVREANHRWPALTIFGVGEATVADVDPADVSTAEPGTLVIEIDFAEPVEPGTAKRVARSYLADGSGVVAARAKVKGAPDWQARAEA